MTVSCCSCNIQNCTPSDSLPRNCSDLYKAISTNPLPCHDTRDSRKFKAYFAAWRTRTTFPLSDLNLLSLIICVSVDFFLITAVATKRLKQEHWCMHRVGDHERVNRGPHSTWHTYWGSPPLSQTYTQRTQSLQTGNWFVHQDFLTASKHNFFFKLVVKRRGIQEFLTCTCILIAASKRFQLQIRFSTAPGNNLKRLQYDLIRSVSRLMVESLLHESPKQLLSSSDESLQLAHNSTRGAKKWQNQNHRPRFERNFRKKKRWRRG